MITGIAYVEMRVREFDECREIYGRELGLTEVQDTTAVLNERGEYISTASAERGDRESILQVGDSFLVLHEDGSAVTQVLPNGEVDRKARGSVGHYAFYSNGNEHTYTHLKEFLGTYRHTRTKDGPQVQGMNHAYLQRTLLEFADPNGYTIQFSEIVDPRLGNQERRREKANIANLATGGLIKGFDHLKLTFSRSAAWVRRNPVRVLPICAAYLGIMGSVGARLAELAGLVLDTAISLEAPNG